MANVTIKDVAEKAGVSISTVSKVMNGWKTISEKTVSKVYKAAEELDYSPNARAVSFARGSTHNIIYLTVLGQGEAYKNPHMFDIMCGAFSETAKSGYTLTLMDISDEEHPKETIESIIDTKSADGIIIHGSAINQEIAALIIRKNFPHIVIGHPDFDNRLCWIDTNHLLAGQHAAEYLLQNGITHPAFIAGRKTEFISHQREHGFSTIMRRNGHKMTDKMIIYTDSSWQAGYSAAQDLLGGEDAPDAIVCENNALAVGVSRALRESDAVNVDKIKFMTFDIYPYTSILDPAPTVVDINVYDMGQQAGSIIIKKIENPQLMVQSYTTLPIIKE